MQLADWGCAVGLSEKHWQHAAPVMSSTDATRTHVTYAVCAATYSADPVQTMC